MPKQSKFIRTQIRIPPDINGQIESFASENDLSKNEAMLFLMLKGMDRIKNKEGGAYPEGQNPFFDLLNRAVDEGTKARIKDD